MKIKLPPIAGLTPEPRHVALRTSLIRWASCFLADAARTADAVWRSHSPG